MTQEPCWHSDEDEANLLVGRFLSAFARLEFELDIGIGKLLGLGDGVREIVAANLPFVKKVSVFFSAEELLGKVPDAERQALLKRARSQTLKLNDVRKVFVHNVFMSDGTGGVIFRHVVAATMLKITNPTFLPNEIGVLVDRSRALSADLKTLVREMRPYTPALDFSEPRNSALV